MENLDKENLPVGTVFTVCGTAGSWKLEIVEIDFGKISTGREYRCRDFGRAGEDAPLHQISWKMVDSVISLPLPKIETTNASLKVAKRILHLCDLFNDGEITREEMLAAEEAEKEEALAGMASGRLPSNFWQQALSTVEVLA